MPGIPQQGGVEPAALAAGDGVGNTAIPPAPAVFPSSADPVPSQVFALFVGPNADVYYATYARMLAKDPGAGKLIFGWCWPFFFVPIPWLLYRKQWAVAAALILIPMVLAYLFPSGSSVSWTTVLILGAIWAKCLYVHNAIGKIRAIAAAETDPARRDEKIRQAGGVSVAGAVIGAIVMAVFLFALFAAERSQL